MLRRALLACDCCGGVLQDEAWAVAVDRNQTSCINVLPWQCVRPIGRAVARLELFCAQDRVAQSLTKQQFCADIVPIFPGVSGAAIVDRAPSLRHVTCVTAAILLVSWMCMQFSTLAAACRSNEARRHRSGAPPVQRLAAPVEDNSLPPQTCAATQGPYVHVLPCRST